MNQGPEERPSSRRQRHSFVGTVMRGVRDAWLMVGITLVLFIALEVALRLTRVARGALRGKPEAAAVPVSHPYAGELWFAGFEGEDGLQARRHRYDPYRGFWARPLTSPYITIDSAGLRVTHQPASNSATARRIFMLGGSVMWGYTARDSFTIPALAARHLAAAGIRDIEIRNLAQRAFNTTQEANTLSFELAHGRIPDVAVFLHGFNDIMTAVKHGQPGFTYGQEGVQRFIDLGTRNFWQEVIGLGRHSAVVQRLSEAIRSAQPDATIRDINRLCADVARYYRHQTRSIEALGREYGFTPVFLLQPVHSSTGKRLSAWEQTLKPHRHVKRCTAVIDSAMADRRDITFYSLTSIFDQETATVFVDRGAHLTEAANDVVAKRIADLLTPIISHND